MAIAMADDCRHLGGARRATDAASVSSQKTSCARLCDPQPANWAPVIADHGGLNLGLHDSGFEKHRDELRFEAVREQHRYRATPLGVGDQLERVTKPFGVGGDLGLASLPSLRLTGSSASRKVFQQPWS